MLRQALLVIIVLFSLYFPTFNNVLDNNGVQGFLFISAVSSLLIMGYVFYGSYRIYNNFSGIAIVLFIWALVITFDVLSSFNNLMVRDVFELYRPFSYFLFFVFGSYLSLNRKKIISNYNIVVFSVLGIVFLGVISYFLFDPIGRNLLPFYTKEHNVLSRRITGTFNNPYDFAFVALLPLCYFFLKYVSFGGMKNLFFIALCAVSIVLSQSKAGVISLAFCFVVILCLYPMFFKLGKIKKTFRFFLLPALVILIFSYFLIFYGSEITYLVNGLAKISSGAGDKSTNIRLDQVNFVFDAFAESPLRLFFGFGPRKGEEQLVEILPFLYLYRYGFAGLFLLGYWLVLGFVTSYQAIKLSDESEKIIYFSLFCWFLAVITAGMGNNVIDQSRVSFIFFSLLGFSTQSKKVLLSNGK